MKREAIDNSSIRRVAVSSFIGTAIEWYDFFIFNVAAFLSLFNKPFFGDTPLQGFLFLFGTYSVGFVGRPIGGLVCGHFGDRLGRKKLLIMTLLITSLATVLIGVLPGRNMIGNWSPWLLFALRFAQGFGIGGEWGGAVLMTVERAPSDRRGFYGSWPQIGVPVGLFLAYLVFFGLVTKVPSGVLPFDSWRLPFLFSIVLVSIGLYIRISLPESPFYQEIKDTPSKLPLRDIWRWHRKDALLAMGAKVAENGVFYIYTVFLLAFVAQKKLPVETILIAIPVAAIGIIVTIPIYGSLSDRFGRRSVYLFGALFAGLFAFPSFWLVQSGRPGLMIISVVLAMALGWAAMYAPQASFFAELFETRVRYSGTSIGAQVATIFAGGLMQVFAVGLLKQTNSYWPIALIIVGMAAVTCVCVLLAGETFRKHLGATSNTSSKNIQFKSDASTGGLQLWGERMKQRMVSGLRIRKASGPTPHDQFTGIRNGTRF
jgi:MHS family shikimate/dehydroshikimate transporter-like MFS transporter